MKRTKKSWITIILIISFYQTPFAQQPEWKKYNSVSEAGFSQAKLDSVRLVFNEMNSANFLVIHKGNVLLSLGDPTRRFMCHSIRKSFMSAMYGIYKEKGKIDLDKTLQELNIQDKDTLDAIELNASIKHLISARSGIYHPAAYEPRGMQESRPERRSAKPGESFFYNNWDFNTLSTIFQQETNQDFFEAFIKDIATPIGMQDLRKMDMNYRSEPNKSIHPAYLFKMSSRDLARFGQLYLQEGSWGKNQIISKNWVKESTIIHSIPRGFDGRDGYGYLWWIDNHSFNETAYYASGLGGHAMYVFPKSEIVIVHRVNSYLNQSESPEKISSLINLTISAKTGNEIKRPELIPFNPEDSYKQNIRVSTAQLEKYTGIYSHRFFKEMKIYLDKNQLKITGEILGNFLLFPKSNTEFIVEDVPELPLIMVKADADNPAGKAITEVDEKRVPVKMIMYY